MQASPRLRFNKEGSLLAVTANENAIKVIANSDGQRMLRMLEGRAFDGSRGFPESVNIKVYLFLLLFIVMNMERHILFFLISQPPFAGSLGANVSNAIQPVLEHSERMQTPLSIGNLVSISHCNPSISHCNHCNYHHLCSFGSLYLLFYYKFDYFIFFAKYTMALLQASAETSKMVDTKPKILDNAEKIIAWKFPDVTEPTQLRAIRLSDPLSASKVCPRSMPLR